MDYHSLYFKVTPLLRFITLNNQEVESLLSQISETLEKILSRSENLSSANDYYLSPSGMERLESTCMLLIAIGESLKGIDKLTNGELLKEFPEVDWKGAKGLRDIIAHHYFELDGDIVFDVVKTKLRPMLDAITQMQKME